MTTSTLNGAQEVTTTVVSSNDVTDRRQTVQSTPVPLDEARLMPHLRCRSRR